MVTPSAPSPLTRAPVMDMIFHTPGTAAVAVRIWGTQGPRCVYIIKPKLVLADSFISKTCTGRSWTFPLFRWLESAEGNGRYTFQNSTIQGSSRKMTRGQGAEVIESLSRKELLARRVSSRYRHCFEQFQGTLSNNARTE